MHNVKITQSDVRTIARAFGLRASWSAAYREYRVSCFGRPNDTYFTDDAADAIYTILAMHRHYRNAGLMRAFPGE